MKYSVYSAVVVGSGLAGIYSALRMSRCLNLEDNILLATKYSLEVSNSYYAQGGMVGVMSENKEDSVYSHVQDTLKAGAGLNIENVVREISQNSDVAIKDLLTYGTDFDRDDNGAFCYTLEAAHSVRRVLHSGGDATGRRIQEGLINTLEKSENIEICENRSAVDILIDNENTCKGVIFFNSVTGEYEVAYAPVVVLATGGIGQLYKYTTNPKSATGDGIALCYNAGLILRDMEFVQFHPTAFAISGVENRSLITEALRGEGAKLVHADGERFMEKYDERKELAPRDIVTRAIAREMIEKNTDKVYLDAREIGEKKLAERFPTITKICAKYGINIAQDLIPVAPAAHYFMGGVEAKVNGETSVKGLFAIGETASTGLHGGNRLASNSLLECVVSAYELVENLKTFEFTAFHQIDEATKSIIDRYSDEVTIDEAEDFNLGEEIHKLKEIMWDKVGIFRNELGLKTAIKEINELILRFNRNYKCINAHEYEYRNMLTVAKAVTTCALMRKESRGGHFREDYPSTLPTTEHSFYKQGN